MLRNSTATNSNSC